MSAGCSSRTCRSCCSSSGARQCDSSPMSSQAQVALGLPSGRLPGVRGTATASTSRLAGLSDRGPTTCLVRRRGGCPAGPRERGLRVRLRLDRGSPWTGLGRRRGADPEGWLDNRNPSPPAIWMPDGRVVTPDIRDAERLQGFPVDWTACAHPAGPRNGPRWRLIGNAVTVPMASWLGRRLHTPGEPLGLDGEELKPTERWPDAAWGENGRTWRASVSAWPRPRHHPSLETFLQYPTVPLSARATNGFLNRAEKGRLNFPPGFLEDLRAHRIRMTVED